MVAKRRGGRRMMREPTELGCARIHLTQGCCLITGGCPACNDPDGHEPRWQIDYPRANALWRVHRAELTAEWAARLDALGGPGLPAFGALMFDGAELPEDDPRWPEKMREMRNHLALALYEDTLPRD